MHKFGHILNFSLWVQAVLSPFYFWGHTPQFCLAHAEVSAESLERLYAAKRLLREDLEACDKPVTHILCR